MDRRCSKSMETLLSHRDTSGDDGVLTRLKCFNTMWTALHVPAVNVPGLIGSNNLPVGLSVVGARWADEQVLRMAATLGPILNKSAQT